MLYNHKLYFKAKKKTLSIETSPSKVKVLHYLVVSQALEPNVLNCLWHFWCLLYLLGILLKIYTYVFPEQYPMTISNTDKYN